MDVSKESFLRNEFLTMSVLGALGRSRTYSKSADEDAKNNFRNALREKLDEISSLYESTVTEEEHLSNIKKLSDSLTSGFSKCLRNGRFRLGIAQKALNLYLKYLWCADFIAPPPHCPFDAIVISYLPGCSDLNWTSIDDIKDYQRLVKAARRKAGDKSIAEWEFEIWLNNVQSERKGKVAKQSGSNEGQVRTLAELSPPNILNKREETIIIGTVTSQGIYEDNKDICELIISKKSSNKLPHEYKQKKPIYITIGSILYEAGVHETKKGVVWISSVLYKKGPRREKARLVDALTEIRIKKGDKVRIEINNNGTYLLLE